MEFIPHEIDQDVFVLVADGGINRDNAKNFTNDVEAMVSNGFNKLDHRLFEARVHLQHRDWERCWF